MNVLHPPFYLGNCIALGESVLAMRLEQKVRFTKSFRVKLIFSGQRVPISY